MTVKKKYTVQDLADIFGISPQTIRNYERIGRFPLSRKDNNNWRFYTQEDINKIKAYFIQPKQKG